MLTKLSYSVTFPTTGRTLAGEFDFNPGFGLITGANEHGKSLIIEVVRWCLFGSAALRGKAEDYKTLRATLEFSAPGPELRRRSDLHDRETDAGRCPALHRDHGGQ